MRHLKIFYAAAFAHIYPSVKPVKTEFVAVLCLFNIDELIRRALPADLGVERRGKERSKNEIDAVSCGIFHVVLDYSPVLLTENIYFIISRKAVAMEPHCTHQLLRGKLCGYNVNGYNIRNRLLAF